MSANLQDFVQHTMVRMEHFDPQNVDCIKKLVKEAIHFYKLNSYQEEEETVEGTTEFLYIHSMMEENLLSKVVELSMGTNKGFDIEEVYKGCVIREY
ncbi:DUF6407 family protein [Bacillus sp. CHD6a]|uniref:DUF6407 family protein n=1 Tax=Bacillus sp. CHD6a TaxID=1643452 RepID=UPI0006CD1481|nr:DUF6407 family protein [Bacillus sp. CHD6a]KPB05983.1 hypothetical protein AAV98_03415 [Bacillus sp. CHD6a]